jgi:hypothetical protein
MCKSLPFSLGRYRVGACALRHFFVCRALANAGARYAANPIVARASVNRSLYRAIVGTVQRVLAVSLSTRQH